MIGTGPILSLAIAGVVCIVLGLKVEIPIKKQHNQKRFYEICLKILEQYIPPKNEVNNPQNLKCIVKINIEQNRKQFGKFNMVNVMEIMLYEKFKANNIDH